MSTGVLNLNRTEAEENETQDNGLISNSKSWDTVEISAEAMELLKAKMEEYGAGDTSELTDEQKSDLQETMENFAEANGSSTEGISVTETTESSTENDEESSGEESSASGAAGASGSTGGSDTSDQIDELEEQIEKLESKAENDPAAEEQLKAKQNELAQLQSELAELQQEQSL